MSNPENAQEPLLGNEPAPEVNADPAVGEHTDTLPSIEEQFRQLELQSAEHHDAWLRAKAEGENIRRRAQEDISKAHKFAVEKFAGELLAVKDSLEAALAAGKHNTRGQLQSGVELTLKQLISAFQKTVVESMAGEKLVQQHQADRIVTLREETNTVVTVSKVSSIAEWDAARWYMVAKPSLAMSGNRPT